ncbi:hypothetical protein L6452_24809 [Arctium lappa]|uniref:Uncharacterized protein n=1 Tax=Arctium lappa TaxID=4217 RepID=A0ACB9AA61_ARCLA|nr:hypothetical protein L6452_24809 [Arctium lappa]
MCVLLSNIGYKEKPSIDSFQSSLPKFLQEESEWKGLWTSLRRRKPDVDHLYDDITDNHTGKGVKLRSNCVRMDKEKGSEVSGGLDEVADGSYYVTQERLVRVGWLRNAGIGAAVQRGCFVPRKT